LPQYSSSFTAPLQQAHEHSKQGQAGNQILKLLILLLPLPLLLQWPGRKKKVAGIIIGMIVTGVGIPGFAVWYQQSKLKG
jgi:hypothetical protein